MSNNEHNDNQKMSETERKDRATTRNAIVKNGFDLLGKEDFEAAWGLYNSFDSAKKRTSKTPSAIKARPWYADVYFKMEKRYVSFLKAAVENGFFEVYKDANRQFYMTGDKKFKLELHRIDATKDYTWDNIYPVQKWKHKKEKTKQYLVFNNVNSEILYCDKLTQVYKYFSFDKATKDGVKAKLDEQGFVNLDVYDTTGAHDKVISIVKFKHNIVKKPDSDYKTPDEFFFEADKAKRDAIRKAYFEQYLQAQREQSSDDNLQ